MRRCKRDAQRGRVNDAKGVAGTHRLHEPACIEGIQTLAALHHRLPDAVVRGLGEPCVIGTLAVVDIPRHQLHLGHRSLPLMRLPRRNDAQRRR